MDISWNCTIGFITGHCSGKEPALVDWTQEMAEIEPKIGNTSNLLLLFLSAP